jgi:hypothetical protein
MIILKESTRGDAGRRPPVGRAGTRRSFFAGSEGWKMRTIPGFTAEASLYQPREQYYAARGRPAGVGVLPGSVSV